MASVSENLGSVLDPDDVVDLGMDNQQRTSEVRNGLVEFGAFDVVDAPACPTPG